MSRRRVITLFLIVFVNFLGATIVIPTLPLYAQRHFDASPQIISLLLASFFVAQFIAAPFLGRLSDRIGRLPVLLISQVGSFISFLILGTAGSLSMLFAGRILDGITGGNIIVAQAYITDITPREKRTQGLGIIFAAFGLGYILGPAVGGVVAAMLDDRAPFFVGAAVSLFTVIVTQVALDESLTAEVRRARAAEGRARLTLSDITSSTPLMIILLIGFCAQFSIAILQATIALFGEEVLFSEYSAQAANLGVGLMLTGIGVGQFVTQLFLLRRLVVRFGETRLVVVGALLRSLGMLSLTVFTSPLLVGPLSLVTIAIASGIMMPSLQALATTSVSERFSGSVLGVYGASTSLGVIIGTALGGQLFGIAPTLPYFVAGTMLLFTVLPAIALMRRTNSLAVQTA
ncbi:MAG: MFS transporter [Aggregatilineales bacterium]